MPNLASTIKEEVARLARKEIKAQTEPMRKSTAQYRRDIAQLKRQVVGLQRKVALLEEKVWRQPAIAGAADSEPGNVRFSAKGLASHRSKLGLSAADYAKLAGVSALSIYNWEKGSSRPRDEQLAKLVAVRGMGKREALARLEQL